MRQPSSLPQSSIHKIYRKSRTHLIHIVGGFNRSNTSATSTAVAICESRRTGWGVSGVIGSQSQTVHLGKGKESLPVHIKIILAETRSGRQGRRGVRHNLQHMVSPHGPRMFKNAASATRIMNLLSIRENQAFARSDAPN